VRTEKKKPRASSGLAPVGNFVLSDDAPMTQAEFHGRAWRLANDKARERGWIV
jgi:hypothetical protein